VRANSLSGIEACTSPQRDRTNETRVGYGYTHAVARATSLHFALSHLLLLLVWSSADVGLAQAAPVQAGPIEHIVIGDSTAPLYGPWKFQVGDSPLDPINHSPLWSEPGFDDSKWETVDLAPRDSAPDPIYGVSGVVPGWTDRGHAGHWGYAWYRIRVQVEARPGEKLALEGPPGVDDGYQVFQNGNLLGSFGDFLSSRPVVYNTQPMKFALPQPANTASTARVLAFRVWMEPSTPANYPDVGGLRTAPLLGEASAVTANYQLRWLDAFRGVADLLVSAAAFGLFALVAFSLAFFDRSDRVYLWLGAAFLLTAMFDSVVVLLDTTQYMGIAVGDPLRFVVLRPLICAVWIMVWWNWFGLHRPAWLPRAVAVLTLFYAVSTALARNLLVFTVVPHSVNAAFGNVYLATKLLFLPLMLVCIVQGIRREGVEGWSVLPAVVLWGVAQFWEELNFLHVHLTWYPRGVQVTFGDIANLLLAFVIAGLLLRRLLVTVLRQRLMEVDVKQAQEVQRVILPEPIATIPGLAIESEYRPAREVGGDFFQILPHFSDGSLLIVAGDVAGKGLQAGMLVALLVGAIRTSAQFDPDPLAVLKVLNQRLCGRSQAAATCLALRIAADGESTLANAGHLPPYLNGQPVKIEGSLPLGMIEDAEFSMMCFRLTEGDQLLLTSDGIAEATDADGQLFGFERIEELLRESMSAAALANAAQSFGQEDDISVITITRTAA
jgi:serine phosphatase RsbU (regulator of sigma subunit)